MSQNQRRRLDKIPDPDASKPRKGEWLLKRLDGDFYRSSDIEYKHPMTADEVRGHHDEFGERRVWEIVASQHKTDLFTNGRASA